MKQLLITIAAVVLVGCGPPKAPDILIYEAARDGNIKAVKQHLAAGTDVNADYLGEIPLTIAAGKGQKEIVELLIPEVADVNAKAVDGHTPLHRAVIQGHKEIAELLIANDADVNAKDRTGKTPLDAVIFYKSSPKIAALLRKHGGKTGEELKTKE
jgi:ankyrin repeat protein